MIRRIRGTQKGIIDAPDMIQDYIVTDFNDHIPYFMVSDENDNKVGTGIPKFFSFGINECTTRSWGYKQPSSTITYHTPTQSWYGSGRPLRMHMMHRGDIRLYHTSLFIMQEERGDTNILLAGVVKEEDASTVKELLTSNDINVGYNALTKLAPYIEVWLADDFDIPKSRFYAARNVYRRYVRRKLIDKHLRIILKPRAEMNNLLIRRKVKFATLDLLQDKINNLCQTAASSELKKLSSHNTSLK